MNRIDGGATRRCPGRLTQRRSIGALLIALAVVCIAAAIDTPATVERVIDGDTIKARLESGKIESVRIIGLDTPETKHPRKPVERYGKEATAKAKELLDGQSIKLRMDAANAATGHRDRYKRLLAHVILPDGRMFAETMIRQVLAHALRNRPHRALHVP